jgi:PKD repeat protein
MLNFKLIQLFQIPENGNVSNLRSSIRFPFWAFLFAGFFLNSCKIVPEACFTKTEDKVTVFQPIQFTNCSVDADHFKWDFGDGVKSTDENPIHSWADTGNYTVRLIAFSNESKNESIVENYVLVETSSKIFTGKYIVSVNGENNHHLTITSGNGYINLLIYMDDEFLCNAWVKGQEINVENQSYSLLPDIYILNGNGILSGNIIQLNLLLGSNEIASDLISINGYRIFE